ncbi:MAG: glycosyl transferase family 2 [Pseudomonadota bacterium]
MRLAIVIPVHGDHGALSRLLDRINEMTGVDQVIVSASQVWEETDVSRDRFDATLIRGAQGRGSQLNRGRQAADADLLWFVHADANPPSDGPTAIRQAVEDGADGGYFRFRFDGIQSDAAKRLAALINWRAARGIAYGDQGLWFRSEVFDSHDGFDDVPLFEEVSLVRDVKTTGRFEALSASIGVDPRRWQQTGWISRTLINRALAIAHACGVSPHTLARWYAKR